MSTEGFEREISGGAPEPVPNDFESVATDGDLFIRDLASGAAPVRSSATRSGDEDEDEENDDDNIVTTMMVGEEGRGGEKPGREEPMTTLAVGEEGRGANE